MIEKKAGVYEIYNNYSKKSYIGSSKNLDKRIKEHKRNLKNNKHYNKHLQRAYNAYGDSCFEFNILEICKEEERFTREQHYIDIKTNLYNSCKDVVYNKRNEVKKSTRLKISKALKERKLDESQLIHIKNLGSKNGATNGKSVCKPIKVIIENKIIIYESAIEASRILNISRSLITHRLSGRTSNINKTIKFYYG